MHTSMIGWLWLGGCTGSLLGEIRSLDEGSLDDLQSEGSLFRVGDPDPEEDAVARAAAEADAMAVVEAFLQDHPHRRERLLWSVEAGRLRTREGNVTASLPDGRRVQLLGEGWHRRSLATSILRSEDPAQQQLLLDELTASAPEHCRISGSADVAHEIQQIARCTNDVEAWSAMAPPSSPGLPPSRGTPTPNPGVCPLDIDVGPGDDGGSACFPTSELGKQLLGEWAWAHLLPPVRNQVNRGTCVAFAINSALETSAAVHTGQSLDLSEQALYSIGKLDFDGQHFGDGLDTVDFLQQLQQTGTRIGTEATWGYNPSWCREEHDGFYVDSCMGYGAACSETAHQLGITRVDGEAFFYRPTTRGDWVRIRTATGIYTPRIPSLDTARTYMARGAGVVAGVEATADFLAIGASGQLGRHDDASAGYHAVQVVRITDDYVVVKNSFGCGWGDNGYAYLPVDWWLDHVTDMTGVLADVEVDEPPTVQIVTPTVAGEVTAGVPMTLSAQVSDAEDGRACCTVAWMSSSLGFLGNGTDLVVNLVDPGPQMIAARVFDSRGASTIDTVWVEVRDPQDLTTVEIVRPNHVPFTTVHVPVGVDVAFAGEVHSAERDGVSCSDRSWRAGAFGTTGCAIVTRFDTPGRFRVVHEAATSGARGAPRAHLWVHASAWHDGQRPYAGILAPLQPDTALPLREETLLSGVAHSSLDDGPSEVLWTLATGDTQVEIGRGTSVRWTPGDDVQVPCGQLVHARLSLDVTDANGRGSDALDVQLQGDDC
ncbi:MAG: C1 family peptidase [Myxococcales bacterium]|nr:C1 family peptidase [Myxococcales bacterium]